MIQWMMQVRQDIFWVHEPDQKLNFMGFCMWQWIICNVAKCRLNFNCCMKTSVLYTPEEICCEMHILKLKLPEAFYSEMFSFVIMPTEISALCWYDTSENLKSHHLHDLGKHKGDFTLTSTFDSDRNLNMCFKHQAAIVLVFFWCTELPCSTNIFCIVSACCLPPSHKRKPD